MIVSDFKPVKVNLYQYIKNSSLEPPIDDCTIFHNQKLLPDIKIKIPYAISTEDLFGVFR
jgi:hypothetical protein